MQKRNNDSAFFRDWTTQKLKKEAKGYDYMINVLDCYGVKDCMALEGILRELDRRGIESHEELVFA